MNELQGYAKVYKGVARTVNEAIERVKEIANQLEWVINDNDELDIYIGDRDEVLCQYDGYRYYYLVKIRL